MFYKTYTILLLLLIPAIIFAQAQTTVQDSLYSLVLKEQRKIQVVLPQDYNPAEQDKYEIIYCLDDIANFLMLELNFLQGEGFIPKNMIMVGITNPKPNGVDMRDRDFTPTKMWGISGGAENFHKFIKTELMPFVSQKYKGSASGNVLYGGSLGGLYAIYNFLYDPTMFSSYIAIDPSLWWDDRFISKIAAEKLDPSKSLLNTLFIAGREGNAYREMGIATMDSVLKAKAPGNLRWKTVLYNNESHYSTNFKGFWEGMKFSYSGFYASTGGYQTSRKIVIKPKTGIILKDKPFKFSAYNLAADQYLHYTTNGLTPIDSSPKLTGEETWIKLSKPSKIIVKSIGVRSEYNRSDSAYFDIGEVFKSLPQIKNGAAGGLNYKYYAGDWSQFPDLRKLKPSRTGYADDNFDVNNLAASENFVCVMEGYLKIGRDGYYIIEMGGGNQDSKVYLNNIQILGLKFIKDEGEMYIAPLQAGYYPYRVEYFYKKGETKLSPIYIKPEGVEDFQIPGMMLFTEKGQ